MKIKLGVTLSVLVVLTALLSIGQMAGASPGSSKLTDYYSDPGLTNHVGTSFRSCNGFLNTEGNTSTPYTVVERDGCEESFCFIICTPGPCPQHILDSYPCPEL